MLLSNAPGKLVLPFADGGGKNAIPAASQIGITPGAASLEDGFPPLTRTPLSGGGVPPSGLDMNGILFEMSAVVRWANAGGGYPYDTTFANDANVAGYPKGARVLRSDGQGYWFNTVDDNVTDPESAGAVAAGWVPDFAYGAAAIAMASANITLTELEYGKPVIVITGALTANLNLIFPDIVGEWFVINDSTGPFSITCKTSAGSGVAMLASNADTLYCDGTNIESKTAKAIANGTMGRNVVVNGGIEISQVNGSTLITPINGSYPIDNMQIELSQPSKLQTHQLTNKLNSLGAVNSLEVSVLAQYTPAAGELFDGRFPIEGVNFARFQYGSANAKAGSLQFKARASVAGTYSGAITNYALNRSYPFSFELLANTDTLVTIPNIPGDTGGTWVGATNAGAAYIIFDFGGGSSSKSTAGTWQAGGFRGVTGATQLVAQTAGSSLTIADVQFEVGVVCTQYERKLYDQVLRECQQYLPLFGSIGANSFLTLCMVNGGAANAFARLNFSVPTRVPVTGIVTSAMVNFYITQSDLTTTITPSSIGLGGANRNGATLSITAAGLTASSNALLASANSSALIYGTGAQI